MRKIYWPLMLSIALALGVLLGGFLVSSSFKTSGIVSNSNKVKLNKLIDFIDQEYVDEVNTDSIVDLTVTSILEQLDPHSIYIAKESMQAVSESMSGAFVGIGISFYVYKDTLAVIKDIDNGPAQKAGIEPGDRILYADTLKIFGENLPSEQMVSKLKGEIDTKLKLQIYRKKDQSNFTTTVTRSVIPLKSVDVGLKLDNGLGYIKINRFAGSTYEEFVDALDKLKAQDIQGLVLDLRDNGGGYMDQAIKILDEFLHKDLIAVKTVNKRGKEVITKATSKGRFQDQPIYVLVNEGSASASEIIAGAIQDNDRGLIIGRRTFGKGLVQRELLLGDGSAIRLTTARYYTPSGRSIQKPYNHGLQEYNNDFISRYEHGELYAADSIKVADSLKYKTLKGKIVYGGGGIVPDVFVPISVKHGDDAVVLLMQSGIVSYFVFEQIDTNRSLFESMSIDSISEYVHNDAVIFNAFKEHLKGNGLTFNLNKRKQMIEFYLIAEFINQLKNEKEYYQWLFKEDPMLKAIPVSEQDF